jgi:hypothetical protein
LWTTALDAEFGNTGSIAEPAVDVIVDVDVDVVDDVVVDDVVVDDVDVEYVDVEDIDVDIEAATAKSSNLLIDNDLDEEQRTM